MVCGLWSVVGKWQVHRGQSVGGGKPQSPPKADKSLSRQEAGKSLGRGRARLEEERSLNLDLS